MSEIDQHATDDDVQLVTFRVGGHRFGFNVFEVERVVRYEPPAPLPEAPEFLDGMMAYRDDMVPVIDLRKRLEVDAAIDEATRIMILEFEGGRIGIVVDAVLTLLKVPVDAVSTPPKIVQGLAARYVNGIIQHDDGAVIILAVTRVLSSEERLALEALTIETANE